MIKLNTAVNYSSKRASTSVVNLDNYISIDNILQNKAGISSAVKLPPSNNDMGAYDPGHILVGNIRPYLKKIWFSDRSGGCSADVLNFEVNKGFDPKFVYYAMLRDDFFIHMMKGSKGSKMPRGDKNQILDFIIPDFDLPKQHKIASVLSVLDSKIDLNNKINTELEAMAKLIYDYWFVQFDFPDQNGKPYKSSGGKMVWSEELKREIPKGWEVRKIENLATIQRGNLITEETANTSGDIKVVAAGINYSYKHDESNFAENTITVSSSGANAGYINLWREPIYASDCIVLRGINDTMTFYIWGYLNLVKGHVLNQAHGSAQPHVYPSDLENLFWVEPSKNTLNQFSNIIIPLNKKNGVKLRENQKLVELRDWLLPMLMNGQVKLKP